MLRIEADTAEDLLLSGSQWGKDITVSVEQNSVIARHPSGETVTVTFTPNVELAKTDNNYTALVRSPRYPVNVAIFLHFRKRDDCRPAKPAGLAQ